MKRQYVKVLSVASLIAGLCAANASYAENQNSTIHRTPAGIEDVQTDWNEDVPFHKNPAENPALNPNFNLVSEVNKVDLDFMATVQARYSLYDQTRSGNFDFLNQLAIFGVHLYKNGWTGDLLVRFAGNPLRSSAVVPDSNGNYNTNGNAIGASTVDQTGQVGIRKAAIGYKFYLNRVHNLKLTVGRFAPYGATAYDDDNIVRSWGTDATVNLWSPNGSGALHGTYIDGAMLSYQAKFAHSRLNMEVTVASDLPVFLYLLDTSGHFNIHQNPYQVFGNDSSFGRLSTNNSRAWMGDFAYMYANNWGDIQAAIDFGGKTNAETNMPVLGSNANANNMWYVAASLGYTMKDKMAIGAWYNWTKVSQQKNGNISTADQAVVTYGTALGNPNANYSVFGIGINGTSKIWGQNHIGGKDGVITWGGGYQRFMTRNGFNAGYNYTFPTPSTPAPSASTDVNLYSLALGWARGPVTIEVDWALFTAKNEIFYKGNASQANYANVLYLAGSFDI